MNWKPPLCPGHAGLPARAACPCCCLSVRGCASCPSVRRCCPPSVTPIGVCVCLPSSSDLRGWRGERWEAGAPPAPLPCAGQGCFPPSPPSPAAPPEPDAALGVPGVMEEMGVQWCRAGVTMFPPQPPQCGSCRGAGSDPLLPEQNGCAEIFSP